MAKKKGRAKRSPVEDKYRPSAAEKAAAGSRRAAELGLAAAPPKSALKTSQNKSKQAQVTTQEKKRLVPARAKIHKRGEAVVS
eukprot:SAG31_NODE_886_length_11229_cov_19.134142_6_plen_83_part_00